MTPLDVILSYARDAHEDYLNVEQTSIEADMLIAIVKTLGRMNACVLATKDIVYEFNINREVNEKWKSNAVGKLVARLWFRAKRNNMGLGGWLIDKQKLDRLCKRYNIRREVLLQ